MKSLNRVGWIAIVIFAIAIAYSSFSQNSNSETSATVISKELQSMDVPVKDVAILEQNPLVIQVKIESDGKDGQATTTDMWNKHLVVREVELAYLKHDQEFGFPVSGYELILVDKNGQSISTEWINVSRELPSQNLQERQSAQIDNTMTRETFISKIAEHNLQLLSINITSDKIVRSGSQLAELVLLNTQTESSESDIGLFIRDMRQLVKSINSKNFSEIALLRITITDSKERLLIEYIIDLETQTEHWTSDVGLGADWFPRPMLIESDSTDESIQPEQESPPAYPAPKHEQEDDTPEAYP